jgi:hypothetical protein
MQALLSIFRGRMDRKKDTAVERCDMEIREGPQQVECRLTVRMICGLGRFLILDGMDTQLTRCRRDQIVQAHLRACKRSACCLRSHKGSKPVDCGPAVSEVDNRPLQLFGRAAGYVLRLGQGGVYQFYDQGY